MRNALAYSLAQSIVGFIAGWVLATRLGVDARGALAVVIAPILLTVQIGQLAAPQATQFFLVSGIGRPTTVLRYGIVSCLASGGLACLVLITIAPVLLREYPDQVNLLRILSLTIPLTMSLNVATSALSARRRYRVKNLHTISGPVIRVVLLVGVQVTWGLTVTSSALIVAVGPLLIGLPILTLAVLEVRRPRATPEPDSAEIGWAEFRAFQSNASPGLVASNGSRFLDRVILGMGLVAPNQVGLYVVASSITEPATSAFAQARSVFYSESARADPGKIERRIRRSVGVAVLIAVGLIGLSPLMPVVYGNEYTGSVVPMIILACALPASIVRNFNTVLLFVQNRPRVQSIVEIIGLVVSVVALLVLAPILGAIGAALASFISYVTVANLAARFSSRVWAWHYLPRWGDLKALVAELARMPHAALSRRQPEGGRPLKGSDA